jgi:predicted cupin superfamily sugar epimerase
MTDYTPMRKEGQTGRRLIRDGPGEIFCYRSRMRKLLIVLVILPLLVTLMTEMPLGAFGQAIAPSGSGRMGTDARAQELIDVLKLSVLPKESGYLGIIGESAQRVMVNGRSLAVESQNYYMLTRDLPVNYLHYLESDDTRILIEGGPVDYFVFHSDGRAEKFTLGMNLAAGERPVIAVPAGSWKALRLHKGASYALMANALSPEFTPDRVKIGAGAGWVRRFTGWASWATPEMLRDLIGPNWLGGRDR